MFKKIGIILFLVFAAQCAGRPPCLPAGKHRAAPTGLSGIAFAATQENGEPCPPECVTDSMEIVTWYPSPYNEYEELRLYPTTRDANYCDNDKIGLMYYDDAGTPSFGDDDEIKVCKGTLLGWQEVGGGSWQLSGNNISNSNSGNVGIGTANPSSRLTVNGIIEIVGAGSGIKFSDGTIQTTASTAISYSRKQEFTSNGTFLVPAAVTKLMVEVVGGGGGGGGGGSGGLGYCGGGGGGGGGGGYGKAEFTVSQGQSYAVVVGQGGGGGGAGYTGSPGSPGSNGGTTSFGTSLMNINGGFGGGAGGGYSAGGSGGSGGAGGSNGSSTSTTFTKVSGGNGDNGVSCGGGGSGGYGFNGAGAGGAGSAGVGYGGGSGGSSGTNGKVIVYY